MTLEGPAQQLRIYIGEADKWHGRPLADELVKRFRAEGVAGATVLRGVEGYGANSQIHTAHFVELSADLPLIVEVVERAATVTRLLPIVDENGRGKPRHHRGCQRRALSRQRRPSASGVMEPTPLVLVHGGAGAWVPGSQRLLDAMGVCHEAASAGHARMLAGGSALDAVEAAVRALEDSPVLNAGRGSLPNRDGVIEMDALVMDGATLALGAVAAIRLVRNPVSVARLVAERTPHALLAGEGAAAFAEAAGVRRCSHEDLFVPRQTATEASDTVGAVAVDARGNVAVASSTGGTSGKLAGRVGDTPLPGCGAYADNASAAVAATGDGEAFMKLVLSKRVCDGIANGAHPQAACEEAVALLAERLGAHGGLIAVDPSGRTGIAWNTAAMPHVVASGPR